MHFVRLLVLGFLILIPAPTLGDVKVAGIFGDGMVIQRDVDFRIWGWADPGEKVTVNLDKQLLDVRMTQEADGSWVALIPRQKAGPIDDIIIKGNNNIVIKDVVAGEVWVCSGQSNMKYAMKAEMHAAAELPQAAAPQIRLFTISHPALPAPASDVKGKWETCSPESAANFSAVAYYFGRRLQSELNVPIGLINASEGWTPAEAWMSREALSNIPEIKRDVLDPWDHADRIYPEAKALYEQRKIAWEEMKKGNADKSPLKEPQGPFDPGFMHRPSGFWNSEIAPITRLSLAGVIWYQGETNVGRAEQYARLFPALIDGWRKAFGRDDLPFLFVEIAPVSPPATQPGGSQWHEVGTSPWAELRESQRAAMKLPRVAMAPTLDLGYTLDVHPINKRDVGERLAKAALTVVYDRPQRYSGPVYQSSQIEGDAVRIRFENIEGGLQFRGGGPEGFAICGEDKKWVFAPATLDGNEVVVRHNNIKDPKAVRYAWSDYPVANLFDGSGHPVGSFRTDDWPLFTKGKTMLTPEEMGYDMKTLFKR